MEGAAVLFDQYPIIKIILAIWVFPWRFVAMYLAAKQKRWVWFGILIFLVPFNTFALVEIPMVFLWRKSARRGDEIFVPDVPILPKTRGVGVVPTPRPATPFSEERKPLPQEKIEPEVKDVKRNSPEKFSEVPLKTEPQTVVASSGPTNEKLPIPTEPFELHPRISAEFAARDVLNETPGSKPKIEDKPEPESPPEIVTSKKSRIAEIIESREKDLEKMGGDLALKSVASPAKVLPKDEAVTTRDGQKDSFQIEMKEGGVKFLPTEDEMPDLPLPVDELLLPKPEMVKDFEIEDEKPEVMVANKNSVTPMVRVEKEIPVLATAGLEKIIEEPATEDRGEIGSIRISSKDSEPAGEPLPSFIATPSVSERLPTPVHPISTPAFVSKQPVARAVVMPQDTPGFWQRLFGNNVRVEKDSHATSSAFPRQIVEKPASRSGPADHSLLEEQLEGGPSSSSPFTIGHVAVPVKVRPMGSFGVPETSPNPSSDTGARVNSLKERAYIRTINVQKESESARNVPGLEDIKNNTVSNLGNFSISDWQELEKRREREAKPQVTPDEFNEDRMSIWRGTLKDSTARQVNRSIPVPTPPYAVSGSGKVLTPGSIKFGQ